MLPLVILVAASGLCAALLWVAQPVTEALIGLLPLAAQQDAAVVETLFTLLFFGALIVIAMIGGGLSGFNAARLGRGAAGKAVLGAALGAIGVVAAASYAWIAGSVRLVPASADSALIAWGTAVVLLQSGAEEIYFRGWLQRSLAQRWPEWVAVAVGAAAFASLHILGGARNPISIANLFLGGVLFGLLASTGRGLAGAIAAHFLWNWSEGIGLGLSPNPGIGAFGGLVDLDLSGAALWGGSEEGLNGSIAMSLVLLALLVPLALAQSRRSAAVSARRRAPGRSDPARP